MTISAKVIEDSISPGGVRLTTLQARYPRFIHAEFMTHRVFSRNASSSRAIPVAKMVDRTLADPALFVEIGKNQAGMQAKEPVNAEIAEQFKFEWLELMDTVAMRVRRWGAPVEKGGLGIHKQVANRALEPWQHIEVVWTSTEWDNFFELRNHADAQPEIRALAITVKAAMDGSTPVARGLNSDLSMNWHLPYISTQEREQFPELPHLLARMSTARNARVSYLTHDGAVPDMDKDMGLFKDLVGATPLHASPTEHIAHPASDPGVFSGNLRGWQQFRKQIERDIQGLHEKEKP